MICMVIEPVRSDEAAQVLAFVERVLGESVDAPDSERAAIVENIRSNFIRWQGDPQHVLHLKAVSNGALCGVVMVKDFWNLCLLFVAPERQRHGVGKALVEAAIDACRGKCPRPSIRLIAWRDAVGFYQRLVFTPVPGKEASFAGPHLEFVL